MRKTSTGLFVLLGIGGFLAWRNRSQIQEFFQSGKFKLPMDTNQLKDAWRSRMDRVSDKIEEGKQRLNTLTKKVS